MPQTVNTDHNINRRTAALDYARGWVIFLVIWVHTDHPSWVTAAFVNSFFFFLSGFFFKKNRFYEFTKKQVNGLLVPVLFAQKKSL